jgi:hypothetical protein
MYKTRPNEPYIDSNRHLDQASVDQFVAAHHTLTYSNTVGYLVARNVDGSRNVFTEVQLDRVMGVVPDRWYLDPKRSLNEQIATMNHQVAKYFANGQSLTLYGDALFLDIDMRENNLPIGSTLHIGQCILQVTPEPHNPCAKFRDRFGQPAFVACARNKHLNLRGAYLQVLQGGIVRVGDGITIRSE